MKNIFLILFLLFCFSLNAQTQSSAEIVNFTIDTAIHYKIKYTGNSFEFRIQEFKEGKWISVTGLAAEGIHTDPSIEKIIQDEFKPLTSGKYRLKIMFPTELVSKELEFKK